MPGPKRPHQEMLFPGAEADGNVKITFIIHVDKENSSILAAFPVYFVPVQQANIIKVISCSETTTAAGPIILNHLPIGTSHAIQKSPINGPLLSASPPTLIGLDLSNP
jgi:hypothetical protein